MHSRLHCIYTRRQKTATASICVFVLRQSTYFSRTSEGNESDETRGPTAFDEDVTIATASPLTTKTVASDVISDSDDSKSASVSVAEIASFFQTDDVDKTVETINIKARRTRATSWWTPKLTDDDDRTTQQPSPFDQANNVWLKLTSALIKIPFRPN